MLTRKERRAAARLDGTNWNESEHNTCRPLPEKKFMWFSNAEWPEGTYEFMHNLTHDHHDSYESAQGVCNLFMTAEGARHHNGVRPLKTWVTRDKPACEGGKEYAPRKRSDRAGMTAAAMVAMGCEVRYWNR